MYGGAEIPGPSQPTVLVPVRHGLEGDKIPVAAEQDIARFGDRNEVVTGALDAEGYGVVCEEYNASETLTHRTRAGNLVTKYQGGGP